MTTRRSVLLPGLAVLLALSACAPGGPTTSTAPAPTVTVSSPASPTATPSASPTATPTPTTEEPSSTVVTSTAPPPSTSAPDPSRTYGPTTYPKVPEMPALFYVSVGDGGPDGCGDTIKPGVMGFISETPVRDSLTKLLEDHEPVFGNPGYELTNALADSRLTYVDGKVDQAAGRVDVWLKGEVKFAGTCDIPRIIGQLELTTISAARVPTVMIWVNDKPLAQVLDQRG